MRKFSDATKSEFLSIIKGYYDGDYTEKSITNSDEMMDFAYMHQLNALYCYMLLNGKYAIADNSIKMRYLSSIRVNLSIGMEGDKLSEYLRLNGIPHAFFKGHYIKGYYEPKGIRSMGDIDIYVPKAYMDEVHKYFMSAGYGEGIYYDEVHTYKRDSVAFEVHNEINWFGVDWADGLAIEDNSFDKRAEVMLTIVHAIKHIVGFGCGIRQILDVALLLDKDSEILTDAKFLEDIESVKVTKCYNTLIGVINRWFGTAYPCNAEDRSIDILSSALLDGGVFGMNLNDYATINTVQQQSKFKMYYRMLFPTYERMVLSYPRLEGRRYLLPYYHMVRLFTRGLKEKRYKRVSSNGGDKALIDSRQLFMDELDLRDQYYNHI